MATSSLNNMTVPLGADGQSSTTQGLLMPKLQYRFRVYFTNFGVSTPTTELTKQVMKFDRPHVQFEEIKLPVYNSTIKIAGKHTWQDITCDIRDDAAGNVSQLVGEQLQKQLDFVEQSSASAGIDYKFTTVFQILDGGNGAYEPVVLEEWQILGCYLKDVNYNSMDYNTSDAVKISMTITFDNAVQNPGSEGVGASMAAITGQGIRSLAIAGAPATGTGTP
jgi:hypothetical protein